MILQRNGEASQACPSMCPLVALHRYRLYFKIGGMQLLTFERAILQMRRFEERLIRKHGHLARGAYKKTLAFAMRLVAAFSCFAAVFAFPAKSYLLRAPSSFAPLTPQADSIRRNTKYVCSMGHLTNRYMAHSPSMAVRGGHTASGSLTNQKGFNKKLVSFLNKRFFLLGAAAAVSLARFAPGVGATGGFLRPEVTVNTAGISLVFFLVGLTIKVGDIAGAALNMRLNLLTQAFSLGVLPAVGLGLAGILTAGGMNSALANGVLILMTLPTTVNMCVILTQSAEGNTASAAFNAVLGNCLGVVVTPALLVLLLGRRLDMAPSLLTTFKKLCTKVVLPLVLGQVARVTPLRKLHQYKPKAISRLSECILLTIIYTTFCDAFGNRVSDIAAGATVGGGGGSLLVLMVVLSIVHLLSIACLDVLSRLPFMELSERDRIAAMFCGSHKTLAFGMPLIKTLFEGHPSIGMLATPLLMFHPMQLILGSTLAPTLRLRAERKEANASAVA